MATPFQDIYDRAIFRFTDYDWVKMLEEDREDVLRHYLYSAQSDFQPVCLEDLDDRDDENEQYSADLDDECIEILALGIAFYWLSSKVLSSELLRNNMNTKDFNYFSPANLLRESQDLRKTIGDEYRARITEYSYHHGDIAALGN